MSNHGAKAAVYLLLNNGNHHFTSQKIRQILGQFPLGAAAAPNAWRIVQQFYPKFTGWVRHDLELKRINLSQQ